MHGNLSAPGLASRKVTVGSDSETSVASDSEDWFGSIARQLLGKDAGFGLHLATGFPEGSCYKYVTPKKPRQPPGYLIRALLRTDGGYQWLAAIMDGSDAEWWRELQHTRRLAEAIASIK
jgi:hypothetical protein